MKRLNLNILAPVLLVLWWFSPRAEGVYLCDPVSGILISMAISAAITAGQVGLQYLIAKKQKVNPVDRGKLDDIRVSIPGYGESIVKGWGTFRCAPVWIDYTPIVHTIVTTPGRSGGKGAPKPPTPETQDHIYTQSVFGKFHFGEIQNVTRIWFDNDIVWNTTTDLSAWRYEAEDGTLTGGASTTADDIASGGVKVISLGSGGKVTFSVSITTSGDYDVAVFYLDSTSDLTYNVYVDGVLAGSITCPASGTNLMAVETIGLTLTSGTRSIRFENAAAACPDMDRIEVSPTLVFPDPDPTDRRKFTGLVDPTVFTPSDITRPWPAYNMQPLEIEPGGPGDTGGTGPRPGTSTLTANLAKWGQPQITIYRGTATQDASPTLVALHGAANTPAYRGFACIDITNIQLQNGRLPNVTIEVDQGTTSISQIVTDLFALGDVSNSDLELSALSGLTIRGVLRPSRMSIEDTLKDLMTRFQFDLVEVDGKIKAVLRSNTTTDVTIPYAKLRAHDYGSETPPQDAVITDIDPWLLPYRTNVNYLDPEKDYHNNVQFDQRAAGQQTEEISISLSLVESKDNMKKTASTLLYQPEMEGRTFDIETGPEYVKCIPSSIIEITLPNATHKFRVTNGKYSLPAGVMKFSGVRVAGSIYNPTGFGSVSGVEPPVVAFPSNSKGVIIDGPLFRPEDAGDGTMPVVYVGACPIGGGSWTGAYFYSEYPIGSSNYVLVPGGILDKPTGIGVSNSTLASVSDPSVWDRTPSALTFSLYYDPGLSSASEQDLLANPSLNLLAVINPSTWAVEVIQFASAIPLSPASPFVSKYTVSTLLRGRLGTDNNVGIHTSADTIVIIDNTLKPIRMNVVDIGR